MSAGLTEISYYELYAREKRGWVLHLRYSAENKPAVLKEAKVLESVGKPCKVIRETWYPDSNKSTEVVIYVSKSLSDREANFDKEEARARAGQSGGPGGGGGGGSGGGGGGGDGFFEPPEMELDAPTFEEAEDPLARTTKQAREAVSSFTARLKSKGNGRRRKRGRAAKGGDDGPRMVISPINLMLRIILIFATSLLIGAIATGLGSILLAQLPAFGIHVSSDTSYQALFGIFILSFLMSAVPLTTKYVHFDAVEFGGRRASSGGESRIKSRNRPRPEEEKKPQAEGSALDRQGEEQEEEPRGDIPGEEKTDEEEQAAEEEAEEEEEEENEAQGGIDERTRMAMMRFLSGSVAALKGSRPQLDAYNKFGVLLLLAGANDYLAERMNLNDDDKTKLIRESVEVMGTKPQVARAFIDKLDEYYTVPNYLPMIQAGKDAMERFASGAEDAFTDLKDTFEVWNKPTGKTAVEGGIVTVMFTDMVGSTDMTQERGDLGAQNAVRLHNQIVRAALHKHDGREIKHTGDGIMASFPHASGAVQASIEIQRKLADHNVKNPAESLHLKIGLNAGEPVQEENDLFGTTVQLAARICDKAATDRILVTNVVRELNAGKGYRFVSQGHFELKGVHEPQRLYEVVWSDQPLAGRATKTAPLPEPGAAPEAEAPAEPQSALDAAAEAASTRQEETKTLEPADARPAEAAATPQAAPPQPAAPQASPHIKPMPERARAATPAPARPPAQPAAAQQKAPGTATTPDRQHTPVHNPFS